MSREVFTPVPSWQHVTKRVVEKVPAVCTVQVGSGGALTSDDGYAIALATAIRVLQVLVNAAIYRVGTLFNKTLIVLCSGRKCQSGVFHPCDGAAGMTKGTAPCPLGKKNQPA